MYTMVMKGIPNIQDADIFEIFAGGIICNWWRDVHWLPQSEVVTRLTEKELDQHLRKYGQRNHKKGGRKNGEVSPFISTTAGARQAGPKPYWEWPAFFTALRFATNQFTCDGWILRGWLQTAGVPSVAVPWLAEEIRDVHQWGQYFRFHHQGELTAKIVIPAVCIAGADQYDLATVQAALTANALPLSHRTMSNSQYQNPADLLPLRNWI